MDYIKIILLTTCVGIGGVRAQAQCAEPALQECMDNFSQLLLGMGSNPNLFTELCQNLQAKRDELEQCMEPYRDSCPANFAQLEQLLNAQFQQIADSCRHFVEGSPGGTIYLICDGTEFQSCVARANEEYIDLGNDISALVQLCRNPDAALASFQDCIQQFLETCDSEEAAAEAQRGVTQMRSHILDSCALLTEETICNLTFTVNCTKGVSNFHGLLNLITGENPETQQDTCRELEGAEFDSWRTCLTDHSCADVSVVESPPGVPTITFLDYVNIIEGACQPGCENFYTIVDSAIECTNIMTNNHDTTEAPPKCEELNEAYDCMRGKVSGCEVAVQMLERVLVNQETGEEGLQKRCPDVNFSLKQEVDPDSGAEDLRRSTLWLLPTLIIALWRK